MAAPVLPRSGSKKKNANAAPWLSREKNEASKWPTMSRPNAQCCLLVSASSRSSNRRFRQRARAQVPSQRSRVPRGGVVGCGAARRREVYARESQKCEKNHVAESARHASRRGGIGGRARVAQRKRSGQQVVGSEARVPSGVVVCGRRRRCSGAHKRWQAAAVPCSA